MEAIKHVYIETTIDYIVVSYDFDVNDKPTAGFDLDYTIIKTKSKKKFPVDKDDWMYLHENTHSFLKTLSETHNIVIFSNQAGLKNLVKKEAFMEKIVNIVKDLSIPIKIYISIENGFFRKPLTGLWNVYNSLKSNTIDCNTSDSNTEDFYCGDAAGRKNDFSDTDYMFSQNIGVKFYTPEQLFLNKKEVIEYKMSNYLTDYIGDFEDIVLPEVDKLMIVMSGYQGSGKSTISQSFDMSIASNDIQGTKAKCKNFLIKQLRENKNVVIDNTNHRKNARKEYIDLAKEYHYHSMIIYIDNDINFCYYMNQLRCELSENKSKMVPKIAYYTLRKKFEIPDESECDTFIQISNKVNANVLKYMFPSI